MRGTHFFSKLAEKQTKAGHDITILQAPLTPIPKTVVVQSLSHVRLSATPRTAAHQASLSLTISRRSPKFLFHAISDGIRPSHQAPPTLIPKTESWSNHTPATWKERKE